MITAQPDGSTEFTIYLPAAGAVELVGDFTGWHSRPVPMTRDGQGYWITRASVPPGDHLFSYLVDGRAYMPDYAANGIRRNEFGGWVSCLCVPSAATRAGSPPAAERSRREGREAPGRDAAGVPSSASPGTDTPPALDGAGRSSPLARTLAGSTLDRTESTCSC